MANKVAVIALVLVVAVPILLGYGLAFEEVEKSGWKSGEETNITDLLNNSLAWSYFNANTFDMNGRTLYDTEGYQSNPMYPVYERFQSTATSLQMEIATVLPDETIYLAPDGTPGVYIPSGTGAVTAEIRYTNVSQYISTVTKDVVSIAWQGDNIFGVERISAGVYQGFFYDLGSSISFPDDEVTVERYAAGSYVDAAQGWRVVQQSLMEASGVMWSMNGHDLAQVIMTIDFGGTDPYFFDVIGSTSNITVTPSFYQGKLKINGETVPSQVSGGELSAEGNVWQLVLDSGGARMNYINKWPSSYGLARSYYTVNLSDVSQTYKGVELQPDVRYRADLASVRSVSYPAIEDKTYNPQYLTNSDSASWRITLSNTDVAGSSITFAGNTYTVTDKQITVNGKKMDVNGLELDSVIEDGTRTNRINGVTVGTGTTSVRFGGTWSAIVNQSLLSFETWTENEWQAGEWAFNGVGSDFALVGLLTCGAVFVGLGMYGRRSGAKVGMLMLITGCAAFIFLAMI